MVIYTVIVSHLGLAYPLPSNASISTVLKLKEEIFKVTGIPIKRQILLMATLNSSIVTAGSDASASSLSNSTDNNHLHKNNDRNEHLFYTVPKDSLLQQDMSENDNEKHRYVYLFDRDENETGCDDGMIDVMDIIQRIRHIQGANEAAWGNYLYHKQNFLKLEQTFSNEFLQYDAEKSQPILTPSSSQIFHEDIAKRTNVIKLDQCITDFFGNEYKNLYDTIPIEKIVQWHEFCNQSRDILCGKYYEVHSFAESLNMDMGSTCSIDTGSLSETTAEMHSRNDMLRIYNSVRQQLSQNLSRIKDFQTVLRSSMNTINFLKDAMNKHSEHLEYLRIVINWPEVFQEISRELQRRVSYSSSLQERFSELEKIQGQEISKRQEFISNYRSKCMPLFADIICQMPPPLQFPHKEKLPAFDVSFEQKSLSKISNMEEEINRLKQENAVLIERLAVANQSNRKVIELEQQVSSKSNKISHTSFKVDDVALFMPTGRRVRRSGNEKKYPVYLAFHSNTPHRYLSHESLSLSDSTPPPDYVLGRIILVEECLSEVGKTNEYGVPPGLKYWVLTVEIMKKP